VLEYLELLDLPLPACELYGQLIHELTAKGSAIGDLDVLIASAALAHSQVLVTRNKSHFNRIPGLTVETW